MMMKLMMMITMKEGMWGAMEKVSGQCERYRTT